jgi:hypothetical protein
MPIHPPARISPFYKLDALSATQPKIFVFWSMKERIAILQQKKL